LVCNILDMFSINITDEQCDLYFKVIKKLPKEVCDIEDNDIKELLIAINDGSRINPRLLKSIRNIYVFTRLLKEVQTWHGEHKKSEEDEINSLLKMVSTIISNH